MDFRYRSEHSPTAGAVGDRRRSEDRKSVVPALGFFHLVP